MRLLLGRLAKSEMGGGTVLVSVAAMLGLALMGLSVPLLRFLGITLLGVVLPRERVRRKRMPHALQRMGLPLGPLRHCGLLAAWQWQHGPCSSCLFLLRLTAVVAAAIGIGAAEVVQIMRGTSLTRQEGYRVQTPAGGGDTVSKHLLGVIPPIAPNLTADLFDICCDIANGLTYLSGEGTGRAHSSSGDLCQSA